METNSRNSEIATLMNSLSLARNEINNLRQQLVSLKHSHRKDCETIRQSISSWNCGKCTTNNDFPTPSSSTIPVPTEVAEFPHKFIGYVETGFSTKRAVPRQPGILSQSQGVVRIDNRVLTNPQHALEGLEQFSHMWILFFFHANESNHIRAKVAPPRLNGTRMGVFATRSPHRPSPIGLSLVKIDSVDDNCIFFSGVDMLDGTPVLDVKPFIPQYDSPYPAQLSRPPARLHWHRLHRDSSTDREEVDLDLQDRLLIGEANSSGDLLDGAALSEAGLIDLNARVLDGMDSDEVFIHPQSAQNVPDLETSYLDRSPTRSASQREAPEGSEGPPSPSQLGNIRVANWVTNPPVARLTVQFAEDCLTKLQRIVESQTAASSIQSTISSILSEDPRSVYIRQRYGEEPYSCAIEGLSVTCFFDDTAHICLVTDAEKISAELLEGENDEP